VRPRPQDDGQFGLWVSDLDHFSAYVHADVLDLIKRNAESAAPDETVGLLAGRVCHDPVNGPYTLVMAAENALSGELESSPGHVKLKAIGQTHLRRRLENAHPDREIVGWYHSHPNYPPIFSPIDNDEQRTWNDQNSIGIVYSSASSGAESFGVYRGPGSIRLRPAREVPLKRSFKPQQLLPADTTSGNLTPRYEPLDLKEKVILTAPAARSMKLKIVIVSLVAIIYLAPVFGLYRLDRRLSFTEGRLQQLSVMSRAAGQPRETPPVQLPSTPPATSESSASRTDGPDFHVPVKPLTAAASRSQPRHKKETTPSRRKDSANKQNTSEKAAKKAGAAKSNVQKQAPTSSSTTDSKPAREPLPKATPK
jgi:proteasome lid subunit RPN8/RPN11